ncbi:MAG: 7-cyano-7-deazaguanine synthase QueC [Thermodesulfobacteriota bacterium]|nr:7-cyano-7-deazaguanine synthase QueC [Thermodesulfobacteriota bacterium]
MAEIGASRRNSVILFSGGLDSTTVLSIAMAEGYQCNCISFLYGQQHYIEVEKAEVLAARIGVCKHLVLNLELEKIGGSALTGDLPLPTGRSFDEMKSSIPSSYVPARNSIFLSYALSWAEVLGARDIFIGVNVMDYSGYPDCRPEYLESFEKMADLGTKAGVEGGRGFKIHAPLLYLTKKEIILKGMSLGVDYAETHSCYNPDETGRACGKCDSCRLRLKGFSEAGVIDPAPYQSD